MQSIKSLIPPNNALLVFGALNVNKEDRELSIKTLKPVQIIIDDEIKPVLFFKSWEVVTISAMAYHPNDSMVIYITKGKGLLKIDLHKGSSQFFDISNLKDVHEITVIDNILWIANTRYNEAVAFDILLEKVINRVNLFSLNAFREYKDKQEDSDIDVVDKFHLNQIFKGIDGELYGLVHHVYGKQLIKHLKYKKIKLHGNGGVINLSNGQLIPLNLKSPHTVRVIQNNYWLFDSGNFTINIYSSDWVLKEIIKTNGYGRGADLSNEVALFYAGISKIRKRYLRFIKFPVVGKNMVQIFSVKKRKPLGEIELDSIEQINNVYLVNREVGSALLKL